MAIQNNAPAPLSDAIARPRRAQYKGDNRDPQEGLISDAWTDYFSAQSAVIEKAAVRVASVSLTGQNATIAATDMTDGTLTAGLYRVSYYAYIVQEEAGNTLTISIDWMTNGITRTLTGAAIDGGLPEGYQAGTALIRVDPLTPVRYTATLAFSGNMTYGLDVVLEEIKA